MVNVRFDEDDDDDDDDEDAAADDAAAADDDDDDGDAKRWKYEAAAFDGLISGMTQ